MYKVLIAVIGALAVLTAKTEDFTGAHEVTTDEFTDFVKETTPKKTNDGHPYITSANKKCECSIFNTSNPSIEDKPIIVQSNTRVDYCDSEGEMACSKFCAGLALAAPKRLCDILGHYNDLEVFLYSRICDSETWTSTGFSRTNICCHEHKVANCSYGHLTSFLRVCFQLKINQH